MTDMFFMGTGIPRDDSGRPLIMPRGQAERVPYSRASGVANILEDHYHITKWQMRGLAKGLSASRDLINMIAAESYTSGFAEDAKENSSAGKRIDGHIEVALRRGGTHQKADYGTAIHALTEPGNTGAIVDDQVLDDTNSCLQLWADMGVRHVGTEVFTACDEIKVAGTFDHLSFVPGYGICVTDKKTSAKASKHYAVQLGVYAHSDIYNEDTDQRLTIPEYIKRMGFDPELWNPHQGIIWWVKNGRTQARVLDLDAGWEYAKMAAEIRDDFRKWGVAKDVTKEIVALAKKDGLQYDPDLRELANCSSVDTTAGENFFSL